MATVIHQTNHLRLFRNHNYAFFVTISKVNTLNIIISFVLLVLPLFSYLLVQVLKVFLLLVSVRERLGSSQLLIFYLLYPGNSLRPVCVNLILQDSLNLLFNFLLIYLSLYLLFSFLLFICGRYDFSNFESYATNLYYVSFSQSMTLDILLSFVAVLHNFPKHPLRILKKIFILYEVITIFECIYFRCFPSVFSHFDICICSRVDVLMIDPPVLAPTRTQLSYQIFCIIIAKLNVKIFSYNISLIT